MTRLAAVLPRSRPWLPYVFVGLLALTGGACEERRRLPYVEPVLHDWPEDYTGQPGLRLHVFHTGSLDLPDRLVYRGGSVARRRSLTVLSFGVEHPRHGLVLIGTGLNRNVAGDAAGYLGPVRAALVRAELRPDQDVAAQLDAAGFAVDDVRFVVMPDLGLDHAGEVETFTQAEVIVARQEHAAARSGQQFDPGRGRYLPGEFDQVEKWRLVDFAPDSRLATFPRSHDLFEDGSIVLIDVHGATAGGLAVLVRLPQRPVLLCGNLAWTEAQARFAWMPGLAFDRAAWWESIWRLKKMKDLVPSLSLLPGHDLAAARTAADAPAPNGKTSSDIVVHEFPSKERADRKDGPA